MSSFWHIDAGNITVLLFVLATFAKVSVKDFQHKLMWHDYQKRHGMNGKLPE